MAKRKKENDEPSPENLGQPDDSADNFGLPEIEYKPLDRTQAAVPETPPAPEPEPTYKPSREPVEPVHNDADEYADDEPKSSAPMIITIIIVLMVAAGGFLLYKYWYVPKSKATQEQLARDAAAKKKQEDDARIAKENEEAERKRLEAEAALKAHPPAGTIEELNAPTRRYYVVVSSAIDVDLLMDYAKKLSAKGVSSSIIPSFGKTKFHRLAVANFDTFAAAQTNADASKGDYGPAVWVMRY